MSTVVFPLVLPPNPKALLKASLSTSRTIVACPLQEADFIEVFNNETGFSSLQAQKTQLAGSFRGQVVCYERFLGPDNATLTDWQLNWDWQAASKDNPVPLSTPPYAIIFGIGAFFFYAYAFGLPLFLGYKLYFGRHRLNELRFGRKFGYLYKRYESGWYAWELVVMARKVSLAVIEVRAAERPICTP